ncbi:hypothetical protein, partial [Rhizobium sp.]|uniref:hypothetical protein n=1 Tax=Rhizobium sp. TaxID=391 RepID=UPI003F7FE258
LASVAPSGAEPTQAVPAEDVTERPLSRMRSDDGRPMWEQISDLIKFHMNERPPIRLRDELVTILDWARYGEARLIDAEAEATSLRRKLEEHRTALAEARQQTSTRDDERCRWPECTCYGPQAPNHCKRQTRRTLDARALSEREGQEE